LLQNVAVQGSEAFCSGGDVGVRSTQGYVGTDKVPRLNVLDLQVGMSSLARDCFYLVALITSSNYAVATYRKQVLTVCQNLSSSWRFL
jgi:1,4-dihydroxy-2-naphthoyl-CoA synthase